MARSTLNDYVDALKEAPAIGNQVVFHHILKARQALFASLETPWPEPVDNALQAIGVSALYRHQAEAISHVRAGRHVVVATPTASGKTLVYNLPVLEKIVQNADCRALYLFPLKALAQDQRKTADRLFSFMKAPRPSTAIYDGDTSAWHRKKIRQSPPNILITNPEMLHLSLLPYHHQWHSFFSNLKFVVIDEVHTYRGIFGANMAWVLRRLRRICSFYNAKPTFVFCSATVGNPDELAGQLTGLPVQVVMKNNAPRGRRPPVADGSLGKSGPTGDPALGGRSAPQTSYHRLHTVQKADRAYCAVWQKPKQVDLSHKISAYRAGFLPEERREIEKKLSTGELLAVISTSALELGIDIGDLDLCLLVGYPGTMVSTWQRGGRVGRSGQDAALVMIGR